MMKRFVVVYIITDITCLHSLLQVASVANIASVASIASIASVAGVGIVSSVANVAGWSSHIELTFKWNQESLLTEFSSSIYFQHFPLLFLHI